MLHLVPLARPPRVMAHRHVQPLAVGEPLQARLPQARPVAVTAPGVGSDQQLPGLRVMLAPQPTPPASDAGYRERRRVVIHADIDEPLVMLLVVDAVGKR